MSRRIKENLLNDHNLSFNSDDKDHLYSEYSDVYKEKHNIRPRWIHPNDVSVEELKQMLNDLHDIPDYDLDDNYHDYKGNEKYYDDLNAKHVTDIEINDLANKGSEDGDEFHSFIGMGKNQDLKSKIYKALKKQPGVKNPRPPALSKYNKDELKENNKVTIGQLRQIIREELLKIKK